MQSSQIFLNASKGLLAKESDWKDSFSKTSTIHSVIDEILLKGEIQIAQEERGMAISMHIKEVASIVAEKCLNPITKLPYPVSMISQAMSESHFSANLSKTPKQQALEVIRLLIEKYNTDSKFPIARAHMRLLLSCPLAAKMSEGEGIRFIDSIKPLITTIEDENMIPNDSSKWKMTLILEPGNYRNLMEKVNIINDKGRGPLLLQLLSLRADE